MAKVVWQTRCLPEGTSAIVRQRQIRRFCERLAGRDRNFVTTAEQELKSSVKFADIVPFGSELQGL
jgi:hypothetical protein